MALRNFFCLSKENKEEVIENLVQKSYPRTSFYVLIILASFIGAIGLIINNVIIIIGSVLIAPILYPIIFLGMNVVLYNFKVLQKTILNIVRLTILGILIGFFTTVLLKPFVGPEEASFFQKIPVLPFFYVAVGSGLAASFAIAKKSLQESLPGVAVSISLIPPLTNIGVALASKKFSIAVTSLQLFIINIFGIIFSAIVIFSLMGFVTERKTVRSALKKESKKDLKDLNDLDKMED